MPPVDVLASVHSRHVQTLRPERWDIEQTIDDHDHVSVTVIELSEPHVDTFLNDAFRRIAIPMVSNGLRDASLIVTDRTGSPANLDSPSKPSTTLNEARGHQLRQLQEVTDGTRSLVPAERDDVAVDDAAGARCPQFDVAEMASDPVHQLGVALGNACSEMLGVVLAYSLVNSVCHLLAGAHWEMTRGHGHLRSRTVGVIRRRDRCFRKDLPVLIDIDLPSLDHVQPPR
jgi:hypothetical protein